VVWPHRPATLQQFLHHLNSLGTTIKFTTEVETHHQKDFNKEIKDIIHALMLNEYPQEFVDSIMKP
jgi:hypothetical protein